MRQAIFTIALWFALDISRGSGRHYYGPTSNEWYLWPLRSTFGGFVGYDNVDGSRNSIGSASNYARNGDGLDSSVGDGNRSDFRYDNGLFISDSGLRTSDDDLDFTDGGDDDSGFFLHWLSDSLYHLNGDQVISGLSTSGDGLGSSGGSQASSGNGLSSIGDNLNTRGSSQGSSDGRPYFYGSSMYWSSKTANGGGLDSSGIGNTRGFRYGYNSAYGNGKGLGSSSSGLNRRVPGFRSSSSGQDRISDQQYFPDSDKYHSSSKHSLPQGHSHFKTHRKPKVYHTEYEDETNGTWSFGSKTGNSGFYGKGRYNITSETKGVFIKG